VWDDTTRYGGNTRVIDQEFFEGKVLRGQTLLDRTLRLFRSVYQGMRDLAINCKTNSKLPDECCIVIKKDTQRSLGDAARMNVIDESLTTITIRHAGTF
jgi:hypothetical protein